MEATIPSINSPTVRSPVSPVYGSSEKTEVTIFVLLTGILAGLLLVVIVLCICKCCVKTSKPLKRQQVVFTKYTEERESTWNGKETTSCTKYHSMEPRSSPSFSVPIDVEVGYIEGISLTTTTREPEDRLLEVSALPPNVRTPGGRVFPECSRESSPKKKSEESPTAVQFPFVPRFPDETPIYKSRRFPRSPPIQRQSSICLPNSDEHLDRYLSGELDAGGNPHPPVVALASPEESSSFEEPSNCEEPLSSSGGGGAVNRGEKTCRVAAEIHQVPRGSVADDELGSPGAGRPRAAALKRTNSAALLRVQRAALKGPSLPTPSSVQQSTRSLESEAGVLGERKKRPASSPEDGSRSQQLLRPASASDVRIGEWGAELAPPERSGSAEDDAILGKMLEVRCRQNSLLLQGRRGSVDADEEPKSKVRYNDTGSMEEVNDDALDLFLDDMLGTPEVTEEQQAAPGDDDDEDAMGQAREEGAEELQRQLMFKEEEPITLQYRKIWELRATFEEEDDDEEDEGDGEDDENCISPQLPQPVLSAFQEPLVGPPSQPESLDVGTDHDGAEERREDAIEDLAHVREDAIEERCSDAEEGPKQVRELDELDVCPTQDGLHCPALPSQEARRQSYKNILSKRGKKPDSKGSGEIPPPAENSFDSVETEESSTDASRLEVVTTSMESTTDNTDSTGEGQIHRLQQMKADSGYKSLEANGGGCAAKAAVKKQIHFVLEDDGGIEVMDTEEPGSEWAATLNLPVAGARRKEKLAQVRRHPNGKTASKKRREYTRERQVVESSFGSVTEFETDSGPSEQLSGQESLDEAQGKASVFLRFFRTPRPERPARPFVRDFSIDEKSDSLFREFSRRDPGLELQGPRLHSRHRLYQRHMDEGPSSPRHGRSKLSPQDSIEEEQNSRCDADTELGRGMAHIPIIKVAGEDSS